MNSFSLVESTSRIVDQIHLMISIIMVIVLSVSLELFEKISFAGLNRLR